MLDREKIIGEMKSRGYIHSGMYFTNKEKGIFVDSAVLISCVRKKVEEKKLPEALDSCLKLYSRKMTSAD